MKMLKPYYETKNGKLYHGDCQEIIPKLGRHDLVVADPPYGINYVSNNSKIKHRKILNDDKLPITSICQAINHAKCAAYIFCRWDKIIDMPHPKSIMVWIKNNWTAGDLRHEHGKMWEACCFYPQSQHEFKKRIPDVIHANKTNNSLHPTQKPVSLIAQLIQCNVCNNVLDPFAGSGTTAIACERLHVRWTLIETDEKYCEIAAMRIDQELQQRVLPGF